MKSARIGLCVLTCFVATAGMMATIAFAAIGDCTNPSWDDGLCVLEQGGDCCGTGCVTLGASKTCPNGEVCPYFKASQGQIYKYGGCGSWHQRTCKVCDQYICASGTFYKDAAYDMNYVLTCVNPQCTGTVGQLGACDPTP